MAGLGGTEIRCVFVETNLDTCVAILLQDGESIPHFKQRLCKEHQQIFTKIGEINISALKVKRRGQFYHLLDDSLISAKAFKHIHKDWFLYADALSVEKPKTKEKTQKRKQKMKERKQKRDKPVKNQDATPLDMGTVNTNCGEVQAGVAIEKEKKRKMSSTKHSSQSSKRSKISRTLSKDQADANESKDSPSDGVVACFNNPLDVNMNITEAAPTTVEGNNAALEEAPPIENTNETDALHTPSNDVETCISNPLDVNMNGMAAAYPATTVEVNNAALEEAPTFVNANETDALFTPAKKSGSSLLKKRTEIFDLAGNTLVLVGTIGSGLVECLFDHSNKQVFGNCEEKIKSKSKEKNNPCEDHKTDYMDEKKDDVSVPRNEEEQLETETAVVTSNVKNQDATPLDMGIVNTTCGEVQVGVSAPTTVEVNSAALEEAPPIENTNETDALYTERKI